MKGREMANTIDEILELLKPLSIKELAQIQDDCPVSENDAITDTLGDILENGDYGRFEDFKAEVLRSLEVLESESKLS